MCFSLSEDALNFLYSLCEKYRQRLSEGLHPANAKRIYIDNLNSALMLVNELKNTGAIDFVDGAHYISLSPKALSLEQYFKDRAKSQTESKRQQRFQNKISILNVLVPFITFFLGIVVEHYVNIVGWFFSLLQ